MSVEKTSFSTIGIVFDNAISVPAIHDKECHREINKQRGLQIEGKEQQVCLLHLYNSVESEENCVSCTDIQPQRQGGEFQNRNVQEGTLH